MTSIRVRTSALLALTLMLAPISAGAQFAPYTNTLTGQQFSNPWQAWGSFLATQAQQRALWNAQIGQAVQTPAPAGTRPAPPTFKHALAKTDFKFQGQPAQQRSCAPSTASAAERQQLSSLCLQLFRAVEAAPGFRKHNLAAGLTVLLGASLQVSANEEISDAASEQLARVLNEMLIETGLYAKLKPADVQAFYETSVMTGGLILTLAEQGAATQDAALTNAAKTLASAVLKSFGFDL